jgi:type II secretory pathway component GspD/PulD (secretin)
LAIRQLTGTQYSALIKAIETDNRSHILANPQITAMDQQKAEVRMATDEPFTETSMDSTSGRVIENVRFLQVGTILQVTPTIKEDGTVEMVIALDVSSLIEIRNGVPVVSRNMASSTVAVRNNQVLMIGGLKFNREMKVREKVPLLGDIPLLGKAFQSNRKEVVESELILFLQPSIVEDSQTQTQEARIDKDPGSGEHASSFESGSPEDKAESGGLKADR